MKTVGKKMKNVGNFLFFLNFFMKWKIWEKMKLETNLTNGHVDLISENLEEDAMVNISS